MTPIAHVNILVLLDSNFFFFFFFWLFYTPYRNILVTFNFQRLVILELYYPGTLLWRQPQEVKKKRKVEHQGVKHCSGAFYVLESSK